MKTATTWPQTLKCLHGPKSFSHLGFEFSLITDNGAECLSQLLSPINNIRQRESTHRHQQVCFGLTFRPLSEGLPQRI